MLLQSHYTTVIVALATALLIPLPHSLQPLEQSQFHGHPGALELGDGIR